MSKRQHEEEQTTSISEETATIHQEEETAAQPANKMQKPNEEQANTSSSSEAATSTPPVVAQAKAKKLPVTVLTGFLGAGKSTLLNYILSQNHGYRIAIIENEFGEVSIDDALIVTSKEEVVELSNGCLCCTLRGDLIGALTKLSQKKDKFDYICIETTGLALPGPIVQTFYLDEQVRNEYYLDGIVTVVDSKHIIQHLHHHHHEKKHGEEHDDEEEEEENEAEDQVAFADRIIVNKVDLIDEDTKKKVLKKIRKINGLSPICETSHSKIDLSFILNIRAFDIDRVLNMDPNLLKEMDEHQHEEEHHHHKHDHHDAEVTSYAIVKPGVVDKEKFEDWLLDLLTERGLDIYRTKGFLNVGEPKPLVVQAVHSLLDMRFFGEWKNSDTTNKLVFIGKYLDREELLEGFNECLKQ